MGTRGIGPGNRAFLEHGSYSASCVNGRLPFHTTMKNHKFQHFSGNNPRVPDGLSVSQSASLSASQKHADKLADCVCLADGLVTFVTETKGSPQPNPIHVFHRCVLVHKQWVSFVVCLFF